MKSAPLCRPSAVRVMAWMLPLLWLLPLSSARAQRETFEASEYHREAAITSELSKAPSRTLDRKGAAADGKPMTVKATDIAVSFGNVYFKLDSTEFRDKASADQVGEMAGALKSGKLRTRTFLVEGHTCDLGEAGYNLKLSAQRADAIRHRLVIAGVAAERLRAIGFGESEQIATPGPRADATTSENIRSGNRRVVLRLLPETMADPAADKARKPATAAKPAPAPPAPTGIPPRGAKK
jgi:OOP family OmpA-OmpF porin